MHFVNFNPIVIEKFFEKNSVVGLSFTHIPSLQMSDDPFMPKNAICVLTISTFDE